MIEAWKLVGFVDTLARLNTKIEPRELVVKDLVADLSDGVSTQREKGIYDWANQVHVGDSHPSPRMPFQRIPRPVCREA